MLAEDVALSWVPARLPACVRDLARRVTGMRACECTVTPILATFPRGDFQAAFCLKSLFYFSIFYRF